ncbi:MAG: helix-turn-helix transcriptional regulator [Deltaproteobacteria bacterium]|nr:helix-turn-helix transcriptional regulator [Deltaproteobacteria bacterium]
MPDICPIGKTVRSAEDIGAAVREKRKAEGLRQAEAAALCGVGTRFLSELENGKEGASLAKTLRVLHGLGLDLILRGRGSAP